MQKKYLKILLFITALSQLVSPLISKFNGGSNFNILLFTPAPYTFSIWGVITFACFVFSVYHLFFDKKTFSNIFYIYSSILYILFTVWLFVAENNLILGTLLIFIAMLYLCFYIFKEVLKSTDLKNLWGKIIIFGSGMYLGWSSVAIWANLGVLFLDFGMDKYSGMGILLQCLLILGATMLAIFMLKIFNKNIVLFLTFWWAFVGILVGTYMRPDTGIILLWTLFCVGGLNYFYFKK